MDVRCITCLAPLFAGGATLAQDTAGGEVAFSQALERVDEEMRKSQWKKAYEALRGAVADHENQEYVRRRRPRIENDIRKCVFWMEHDAPDPKELVSGKLGSYSRSTGLLRIVYEPDTAGDFESRGRLLIHPATFEGDHTIEIEGDAYDSELLLQVCVDVLGFYQISAGRRARVQGTNRYVAYLMSVLDSQKTISAYEERTLDQNLDSPASDGRPFRIKATVKDRSIEVSFKGKRILAFSGELKQSGRFRLYHRKGFSTPRFDRITVKGRAPAWIQGLQDAAVREEWEDFEKAFRIEEHLPEWLATDLEEQESRTLELSVIPGPRFAGQEELLRKAHRLCANGELSEGLELVEKLGTGDTPLEFRLYLETLFRIEMGEFDEAAKLCERLSAEISGFNAGVALLDARIKSGRWDVEDAIAAYEALLEKTPELADAHGELAALLLWEGRVDEAREIVRSAISAGLTGEALERAGEALVKYDKGPDWDRTYEYVSEHYRIRSDIDRTVCYEASKILESSFNLYRRTLGRAEEPDEPFNVFLFSGESSYAAYAQTLLDYRPEDSWGLYLTSLKQLLIWNLPSRDQMMRTVRHEGLHQYLDHLVGSVPRWFGEGMAEYFENADRNGTKWILDGVHRSNMIVLKRSRNDGELVPLKEFLYQSDGTFLSNETLHYAQGWAVIHFLRHSTEENEAIFDELLTALGEEGTSKEAIDRAFRDADLGRLEEEFLAHTFRLE